MKAYVVSLGCPKNLTDSEVILGNLVAQGCEITQQPSKADIIVVNTCAFLKSARDEALVTIKEMASWKKKGKCQQILIAGCLPKWMRGSRELPEVDGMLDSIQLHNCTAPRVKATPPWYAYVKIAEGCNNHCSYCLIPKIRGRLRIRKASDILDEVKLLAKRGVKEIIYVAQDTTAYPHFAGLLQKTAKIKGVQWIRILYAHPKHLTAAILAVMAQEPKIVKYLDLPIQHVCAKILNGMNRPEVAGQDLYNLIKRIRKRIPGLALRTSVIVGFPGEGEAEFNELCAFLEVAKFERLGAFVFSKEKGTAAGGMRGQVAQSKKEERFRRVMRLQKRISKERNNKLVGTIIAAIIEGENRGVYYGRSFMDAPAIDGRVIVTSSKSLSPGEIVKVRVTKALPYDLVGCQI